jgi:hypothetical protein
MAEKKTPAVKYTSRDFDTIKTELVKHAQRYYPETYKNFGEASFGSLVLDSVAYVGDLMSFYLDYQVNELFMDTASEKTNVLRLASQLGYRYDGQPSTAGVVEVYALIPANSTGLGPDERYMPIVQSGTEIASDAGATFTIVEDVRFDKSSNQVVVGRVDDNGTPTHYAVKASADVVSGKNKIITITVGEYEKFKRVKILSSRLSEVISVVDAQGHEYFEVDYLSQDTIYKEIPQRDSAIADNAPSILRPFAVLRKFVVEKETGATYLQFGHGDSSEISTPSVAEPSKVALQLHARGYSTDQSFDPSKLLDTDKFGISPADTVLTITYRENDSSNVNAPVNSLNTMSSKKIRFLDSKDLSTSTMSSVEASLSVSNSSMIVGGMSSPTLDEIKINARDSFATQNRAVTKTDMEAMAYGMPAKYGAIKRCASRVPHGSRRTIEFYVISQGTDGKLATASSSLKKNLKVWLNKNKMINDSIAILDAKIMNFGIEFSIMVDSSENKYDVLNSAMNTLKAEMKEPLYIGESLQITDIYSILNKVRGVVDTRDVKIVNKTGVNYSPTSPSVNELLSADGLELHMPLNVVAEIKYPNSDIKGAVV